MLSTFSMDVAHATPMANRGCPGLKGSEFQAELSVMLKHEYGITKKLIATCNPQANSMVERIHWVMHQLIPTVGVKGKFDLNDEFGWTGILSAVHQVMRSTAHTTQRAIPA
jgi:hypothetical protein